MVHEASYRKYWVTWVILLALTLAMIGAGKMGLPQANDPESRDDRLDVHAFEI